MATESTNWRLTHLVAEVGVFLTGVLQLRLQDLAGPLRALQRRPRLLPLADQQEAAALGGRQLLPALLVAPGLLLQVTLELLNRPGPVSPLSRGGPDSPSPTLICCCIFLPFLAISALLLVTASACSSRSLMSASSFFFSFRASARPLASTSRLACRDSSAFWWLFLPRTTDSVRGGVLGELRLQRSTKL